MPYKVNIHTPIKKEKVINIVPNIEKEYYQLMKESNKSLKLEEIREYYNEIKKNLPKTELKPKKKGGIILTTNKSL
ncbi:hypothetical protein IPdc08_00604 [archaeon]|nr:hypothetical protein IPdc08_00604 [archaeon]